MTEDQEADFTLMLEMLTRISFYVDLSASPASGLADMARSTLAQLRSVETPEAESEAAFDDDFAAALKLVDA
jgi:hypothetical protein